MAKSNIATKDRESTPLEIAEWLNAQSVAMGLWNPIEKRGIEFVHVPTLEPTHDNRLMRRWKNGKAVSVVFA